MAKRTAEQERIETLESALAWVMAGHYEHYLKSEDGLVWSCKHCGRRSRRLYWSKEHDADCPWRRANELRRGLKPRKWETK